MLQENEDLDRRVETEDLAQVALGQIRSVPGIDHRDLDVALAHRSHGRGGVLEHHQTGVSAQSPLDAIAQAGIGAEEEYE